MLDTMLYCKEFFLILFGIIFEFNVVTSTDIKVTNYMGISAERVAIFPEIKCKSSDVAPEKPKWSCFDDYYTNSQKSFIIGANETNCYSCYVSGNYEKVKPANLSNIIWMARQGK